MRDMKAKESIANLRTLTIDGIKEKLHGLTTLEISEIDDGDAPILKEDLRDDEFTFTLDRIQQGLNGKLSFEGSSSWNNDYFSEDNLDLETLVSIDEFLSEHEDEIEELARETDPTATEKVKKVIRFYQRSWVDIVVEVDAEASEEEVFEKASERYNNGDYDDSDTDFENTDYTDVTDYYKENGLPPFGGLTKSPLSDWQNIS